MQDVTIADRVRAGSDHMIRSQIAARGLAFGRIAHLREPMTPENQTVIRVCQYVRYSSTVLAANAAQDAIEMSGGVSGPFEAPDGNTDQLEKARIAVNSLSTLAWSSGDAFGRKDEVDPVAHVVGALAS